MVGETTAQRPKGSGAWSRPMVGETTAQRPKGSGAWSRPMVGETTAQRPKGSGAWSRPMKVAISGATRLSHESRLSRPVLARDVILGMAYNFVAGDRDQLLLMPPSLAEWLPADHLAWFVLDVVAELDLTSFVAAYRADGRGGAAYD